MGNRSVILKLWENRSVILKLWEIRSVILKLWEIRFSMRSNDPRSSSARAIRLKHGGDRRLRVLRSSIRSNGPRSSSARAIRLKHGGRSASPSPTVLDQIQRSSIKLSPCDQAQARGAIGVSTSFDPRRSSLR